MREKYDKSLVRLMIEKVTVYEERYEVSLKLDLNLTMKGKYLKAQAPWVIPGRFYCFTGLILFVVRNIMSLKGLPVFCV